ncbi:MULTISPECIES: CAP domain-containing protein [Tissierellales]|jgi:uncharacterized YkwD family protein|uniref:SCP domain-containing protein n=1 Tax=Acidilutibacter cellobiosedens TaxID=2507161 RepID=A0A410QFK9_9FIRM|nr:MULTISPECIES: CAP domain-containing protein [Tissierellales]MBE6083681.1 hypothetical protein [Tissierellaceae bacterium]QAT62790.1 hypothetical protein EQM13_15055 [Acidilutibacter cellobiosedens]SCL93387.1 Cysteine-rich secretory protein family protein [Sporanaerobacter sp. PP17-6a]
MKTKFKKTILSLAASTLVLSPFSIAHAGSSNLVYYLPNESCPQKGYTIPGYNKTSNSNSNSNNISNDQLYEQLEKYISNYINVTSSQKPSCGITIPKTNNNSGNNNSGNQQNNDDEQDNNDEQNNEQNNNDEQDNEQNGNNGGNQNENPGTENPGDETPAPSNSVESEVVRLVNIEREKAGLQPLTQSSELSNVARLKSQDMADNNYFSHTSPTYGDPFTMMKTFGIKYSTAGENIAKGYSSAQTVMDGWMNSSGHRANILNSSFNKIGVGYVNKNGTTYWTQMFTN